MKEQIMCAAYVDCWMMTGVKRSFMVSTRHSGRRRFVRVTVYDEVEDMRVAASLDTKRTGTYREGHFDDAHGVTHSFRGIRIDSSGRGVGRGPTAANIRLHRRALGTSVVTHEVCHAAITIYEQDCEREQGSIHDEMDAEEVLCYLVGDLAARIVSRLYVYGYYDEV